MEVNSVAAFRRHRRIAAADLSHLFCAVTLAQALGRIITPTRRDIGLTPRCRDPDKQTSAAPGNAMTVAYSTLATFHSFAENERNNLSNENGAIFFHFWLFVAFALKVSIRPYPAP